MSENTDEMDSKIQHLEKNSGKEASAVLKDFLEINQFKTTFPDLDNYDIKERFWTVLFKFIDKPPSEECKLLSLNIVKILSRERNDLPELATADRLKSLLNCCGLLSNNSIKNVKQLPLVTEALKCLCNITYNFNNAAQILNNQDTAISLLNRMKSYTRDTPAEIKLFDMKLMFLLTALCEPARTKLYKDANALKLFVDILKDMLKIAKSNSNAPNSYKLPEDQYDFCCELLKTLFNILMRHGQENLTKQKELTGVLRDLLLVNDYKPDLGLHGHVINLLTLTPLKVLSELILPGYEVNKNNLKDNPGLLAVSKIVNYVDIMLPENTGKTPIETISPVLLVLLHLAQSSSIYRKYIKMQVLPHLREVHKRPEEGGSLRNKLCRLLTSPLDSVREPVADLLFTLCREDVGRMVKYTGYGNSAGLFARRGLLNGPLSYSSDSDSDTEEYSKHKDEIDPVLGCLPGPKDHSIEEMTDEQKEYLAVELANKIDKLQRVGLIQPCSIGPDGKPQPIEHVLQLQDKEQLPVLQSKNQPADSEDG